MIIKYEGGPFHGMTKNVADPAKVIFPRGSLESDVFSFLSGKSRTPTNCYWLDDKTGIYYWHQDQSKN